MLTFFVTLYILQSVLGSGFAAAAGPNGVACGRALMGISPAQFSVGQDETSNFVRTATEINPALQILTPTLLNGVRGGKYVLSFVGYSGGNGFNAQAARTELTALLQSLNPNDVILASGATDEGVPGLVYELGHKMGFETIGITASMAAISRPARMDYLYIEGNNFGDESSALIKNSDILIAIGGGRQSFLEILSAQNSGVKVIMIANANIRGASANVRGEQFATGTHAAGEVNKWIAARPFSKWLRAQSKTVSVLAVERVRENYAGKKLVFFTGWTKNGPESPETIAAIKTYLRALLSGFVRPENTVVVTSGSAEGLEGIVTEIASELRFTQIAFVSHQVVESAKRDASFSKTLSAIVPVSRTYVDGSRAIVSPVDAVVSLGGREITIKQLNEAIRLGKGLIYMNGHIPESDFIFGDRGVRDGLEAHKKLVEILGLGPS